MTYPDLERSTPTAKGGTKMKYVMFKRESGGDIMVNVESIVCASEYNPCKGRLLTCLILSNSSDPLTVKHPLEEVLVKLETPYKEEEEAK